VSPQSPSPEPGPQSRTLNLRALEHSHAAIDTAGWCTDAARLVHVARRHGAFAVDTRVLRARLAAELVILVQDHAPLELAVTPRSIVLEDEPVLVADNSNAPLGEPALEHELPWLLHRDGIRALRFTHGFDERESGAVLDALLRAAPASATHEDMVTLLWESGLEHLSVRTEEFDPVRVNPLQPRQASGPVPHADDWPSPSGGPGDAQRAWHELAADEAEHLAGFHTAWAAERSAAFPAAVEAFVASSRLADPRPELAAALAAAVVTWIATCVQRSDWAEANRAGELLRAVDPDARHSGEALARAFDSLDTTAITERLDECDTREQARMFTFVVRIGAPALPLLIAALAMSGKARVRAGVTTALAYAFADDPAPLARCLAHPRWQVVRNVVSVLGLIGGAGVVPHLALAARHLDTRVRRAAIHALGQVPRELCRSVLLAQLDHADGRLVAGALAMLAREPDPQVTKALLVRTQTPALQQRPEDQKLALIGALADMDDVQTVAALEELLVHGGRFARRSYERTAAAHALARMSNTAARGALEQGLRHKSEAVREACALALGQPRNA
jgi:HEAT repeat protein